MSKPAEGFGSTVPPGVNGCGQTPRDRPRDLSYPVMTGMSLGHGIYKEKHGCVHPAELGLNLRVAPSTSRGKRPLLLVVGDSRRDRSKNFSMSHSEVVTASSLAATEKEGAREGRPGSAEPGPGAAPCR